MNESRSRCESKILFALISTILLLAVVFVVAIATNQKALANDNEVNVRIRVKIHDATGTDIDAAEKPYTQAFGYNPNNPSETEVSNVVSTKDTSGEYIIQALPVGYRWVVIAGADDFATGAAIINNITEESTLVTLELPTGIPCAFTDTATDIESYVLKAGSNLKIGEDSITFPEDINLGPNVTGFGVKSHATISANLDAGTISYKHIGTNQSIDFTYEAKPAAGKNFLHWLINGNLAMGVYDVPEGLTKIDITPVCTAENTYAIGGTIKDSSEVALTEADGAFAMLFGFDFVNETVYYAGKTTTNNSGQFEFLNNPYDFVGVVFVGAPGHTNQVRLVYFYDNIHNFKLGEGIQCNVNINESCKTVLLKAGSYFNWDGFEYTIQSDVDLGLWFPPFGLAADSTMTFNNDGTVSYVFNRSTANTQSLNVILQVVGQEGKAFKTWLKDGEPFSGTYQPQVAEKEFNIEPVFEDTNPGGGGESSSQTGDSTGNWVVVLSSIALASFAVCMRARKKL